MESIPTPSELKSLFQPIKIGAMNVGIRVVYAPLARCRALGTVPSAMAPQYYSGACVLLPTEPLPIAALAGIHIVCYIDRAYI